MNRKGVKVAPKDLTEEQGNVHFNESMVFEMVKYW